MKKKTEKKADATMQKSAKRQTVVTKGISRKIQTDRFFSLEISHTAQDLIDWETIEERNQKQQNLTKLAIKDFMDTHDRALKTLQLGEHHAFVVDRVAEKQADKDPKAIGLEDMDVDSLDSLDLDLS